MRGIVVFGLVLVSTIFLSNVQPAHGQQQGQSQNLGVVCEPRFSDTDTHILHIPPDGNGIDIDVWCIRGYFWTSYNFVLEISRPAALGGNSTPAGCFFPRGQNTIPPETTKDDLGNLTKIRWVNTDPDHPGDEYIFEYDPLEDMLKITKNIGGQTKVVTLSPAPKSLSELEKHVKDPQGPGCSLELPNWILGFTDSVGTLKVTVLDSRTGMPASKVNVHIKDVTRGWELVLPSDDDGVVKVSLGSGNYEVTAVVAAFKWKIASSPHSITMTGDKELEMQVSKTSILRTEASLSNGNFTDIKFDTDQKIITLLVNTSSTNDGVLKITLPRDLLDAKTNGNDDEFIVLIDGDMATFTETKNDVERTLTVPVQAESTEIEIIGTEIIPEFGMISFLVLAAASATVLVANRFRKAQKL